MHLQCLFDVFCFFYFPVLLVLHVVFDYSCNILNHLVFFRLGRSLQGDWRVAHWVSFETALGEGVEFGLLGVHVEVGTADAPQEGSLIWASDNRLGRAAGSSCVLGRLHFLYL